MWKSQLATYWHDDADQPINTHIRPAKQYSTTFFSMLPKNMSRDQNTNGCLLFFFSSIVAQNDEPAQMEMKFQFQRNDI